MSSDVEPIDIIAGHAGLCPICCDFIAAGSSPIRPLAVPTPPNPAYSQWHAERGRWLIQNQYVSRLHGRTWAHRRCADRLDRERTADEQISMAGDWHAELRAMKQEGERLHGRTRGRQRPKRRQGMAA